MRLIDADHVIKRVLMFEELTGEKLNQVHDFISSEPTIEPQKWIPCSEQLPDMHDEVLVTARGEVSIAWLYVDGEWRSNDMPQPMFKDIVAWMPLPEPYKGVEE